MNGFHDEALEILDQISSDSLAPEKHHKFVKVLSLCMLASVFGHHTLRSLLTTYQQSSTQLYNVFNYLSLKDLSNLAAELFELTLRGELQKLGKQSDSSWSRARPTFVIDASVYKQWLSQQDCPYYNKYFSGQTGKAEWGFKLTLGGVAIEQTFYPLLFFIAPKSWTDSEIAQVILQQMHQIVQRTAQVDNLKFGQWYLSVDSGYAHNDLTDLAEKLNIVPISVPTKSHTFDIDGENKKLSKFIEEKFLTAEQQWLQDHSENEPFVMREKAFYKSKNRDVILLIFRLKGSKKVTAIYTTDMNIKAKTLRRCWFQRTYIEQFFRISKHTLQIAQSKSENADEFLRKICVNFLKAVVLLAIRNALRKHRNYCKNWTFLTIKQHVTTYRISEDMLIKLMNLQNPF